MLEIIQNHKDINTSGQDVYYYVTYTKFKTNDIGIIIHGAEKIKGSCFIKELHSEFSLDDLESLFSDKNIKICIDSFARVN